ncbi:hypothetical protein NECID01_1435 [Nematocida sp. AWRm77]|nr:hypothetical protein NECID01_1435 [Nematocida sp. AWRm77]
MRITHVYKYPITTRVAMYTFFYVFVLSVPMYYLVYYFGIVGYVLTSCPVYVKDSVYCIQYCKKLCFGVITVGNVLTMCIARFLCCFPTRYISKLIAYIIGVFTLPVMAVLGFAGAWYLLGWGVSNLTGLSYKISVLFLFGLGVSLMPPFCRRRAHVIVGMLNPHVEGFKLLVQLHVKTKSVICLLPWAVGVTYLGGLYYYRTQKESISMVANEEVAHRMLCVLGSFAIKICATYWSIFQFFHLPNNRNKLLTFSALFYLGFLGVANAIYIISLAIVDGQRSSSIMCQIGLMAIKLYLEWSVPIYLLNATVAREYIRRVHFGKEWMRTNLLPIVFFDLCRAYIFIPVIVLPLTVTYYIFDKFHTRTTSEISILISFTRMTFTYQWVLIDSMVRVLFLGQKLGMPLKLAKRVTYTDIANSYPALVETFPQRPRRSQVVMPG